MVKFPQWSYCYVDDISSRNNQEFSIYTADVYPKELTLYKSYINSNNGPFPDLYISVLHRKL